MANGATDVAAALEAAVSGKEAPATSTDTGTPADSQQQAQAQQQTPAESQDQSTGKGKQPGPIPYDRFAEVNQAKTELADKVKDLESKLAEAVERETGLRSNLTKLEQEANILESIRNLAEEDEEWRPTLEKLDKRLRGIEEAVEEGTKTEKQAEKETTQAISEVKKELEDRFEEQQTDFIVMQARELADRYLRNLPQDYTDEERRVIGEMLAPRVNWDAVAESPTELPKILADGLKETLEAYGQPRGALSAKLKELEETGDDTTTPKVETPEQIAKRLAETDWSETVETGRTRRDHVTGDEVKVTAPKQSDDDFAKALSDVIKLGNR